MIPTTTTNHTDDVTTRLSRLRAAAEKAAEERAKAEATLESLRQQLAGIEEECRKLGVDPNLESLEAEIARLSEVINADVDEAERILAAAREGAAARG